MNPDNTPKLGQSDELCASESPAEKWVQIGIFKPAEPRSPWDAY